MPSAQTPKDWQQGVTWDGETGHVTIHAPEEPNQDRWLHVFEKFGLDPEKYVIEGAVRHSAWDVPSHGVQHAYKARIVEKPEHAADIQDVLDEIWVEQPKGLFPCTNWRTLQIGDTHIGKSELAGGGTETIVKRWKESVANALAGWHGNVHIAFLGDLIEGYVSQGGANIAQTDLTLTEQLRVARHLVSWTIQEAVNIRGEVIVSAVPGNHGETTRVQGRPHTDSHDLDIVSSVQQAFELAGIETVKWYFPSEGTHHVTYEVGDTIFTSAHGHLFKGQMAGAEKWWAGMTVNNQPPAHAHILMSGHFHNTQIGNFTANRWIMFGPSLETKSVWYHEKTGTTSKAGILVYDTDNQQPTNIRIL